MCQGETPKWRGILSCCIDVDWNKMPEAYHIISSGEGIVVNFSGNHDNEYFAYSKHHPNLGDVPSTWTKKLTQAYRQARKSYAQKNPTDAPQPEWR